MRLLILCLHLSACLARECSSHGCSLLPQDVVFDAPTRKALAQIRNNNLDNDALNKIQTSGNSAHATLTLIGYKGGREEDQINQDRAFIVNPFMERYHLSGVFDGHGPKGEVVSQYALTELPKRLAAKLEQINVHDDNSVIKVLKDTFIEIDKDVKPVSNGMGGCTASVVLQIGTRIFVANAGDSISIVATLDSSFDQTSTIATSTTKTRKSNVTVVHFVTREDKPHLPDERARIEQMGGRVWVPLDLSAESSRVLGVDSRTGIESGLAMSRSIGDWDMIGVVAEPLVEVISLQDIVQCAEKDIETCMAVSDDRTRANVFVVSATDGMMDYIDPQEIAESFANAFFQGGGHPLNVAEDLIFLAANGWETETRGTYRDDIAVAASVLMSA